MYNCPQCIYFLNSPWKQKLSDNISVSLTPKTECREDEQHWVRRVVIFMIRVVVRGIGNGYVW